VGSNYLKVCTVLTENKFSINPQLNVSPHVTCVCTLAYLVKLSGKGVDCPGSWNRVLWVQWSDAGTDEENCMVPLVDEESSLLHMTVALNTVLVIYLNKMTH